jgi:transcriptional regulator with XRE-family HTH domain
MKIDSKWIRARIAKIGGSQAELGRVLGVDRAQITRMLDGERRVQLDDVKPMAIYLEVSTVEMLRRLGLDV